MRTLVLFVALAASAAPAAASKHKPGNTKKVKRRGPYGASSRVVRPAEAHGEASLRVRSIDLSRRAVVVEVVGFPRPPAGNLFTFTDDRGRKFIAVSARCDEPFPSGARVCDLETPTGYERHAWVAIELHLHGLQSATVAAPVDELARALEAARSVDDGLPRAPTPPAAVADPAAATKAEPGGATAEPNAATKAEPRDAEE